MSTPLTAPGRLVAGRYRLQSQIGGGGMGAVWLALDELLGRQVAVKQVLVSESDEALAEQQRQRALREGRIAARLSHPHAISVYDVAQEGEVPWLVMEYLPSRSLAEVVQADGVLRVDQVAQIGAQVADALAATHAAGIVHRDVKPANILIGQGERIEGLVKITDFGISHAHGDVTLTQTGQITGTPAFLAPEVAQGYEMGEASDVFSLGATLYTCLEGQPPFGMEDNALAMLHKVAGGSIRPPARAGSLSGPLTRMLAADPAERPSMAEVRDELARLAAGRSGDTTTVLLARTDLRPAGGRPSTEVFPAAAPEAAEPPPPPPPVHVDDRPRVVPAARPPARRRGVWVAAALAVVAVAALIGFWALGRDDPGGSDTQAEGSASPSAEAPASASPSASEEPQTEDDTTADPTDDAAPSAEPTEPTGQQPTEPVVAPATDPASAVRAFFALVPGNLDAAYQLTSPGFQQRFPLASFSGFWDDFSSVQISNIEPRGDDRALADITYVRPDGSSTTERHELRFEADANGRLLLDRDEQV
ncbi:Serine/threonine protein kinase [Blastococcus aggregatus]|uniref:non-specific serine/threonine protein kinase n=1 Tax=Blastococcus aggregatus TaxID=38502 RepID=A0A285V0E8_9ACTN|nr:serine/threonine-protein kinase [Blastococcus aggregatus]SOC47645.1 Serine/threonine protein kinase [Blastococcus aggregatus]